MSEEREFLSDKGSVVTSSRVVIGKTTYATRNISSVRMETGSISWVAVLLVLLGLPQLVADMSNPLGWGMLAVGAIWGWVKWVNCSLYMTASGAESLALKSSSRAHVQALHDAIAQAIATR